MVKCPNLGGCYNTNATNIICADVPPLSTDSDYTPVGGRWYIPYACVGGGSGNVGCPSTGEWGFSTAQTDDGKKCRHPNGSYCTGGIWKGHRVYCPRVAYNGDPAACCLGNGIPGTGITRTGTASAASGRSSYIRPQYTCDPAFRRQQQIPAASGGCAQPLADYCSTHLSEWLPGGQCIKVFDSLYNEGIADVTHSTMLKQSIEALRQQSDLRDEKAVPLWDAMTNACRNDPGACNDALSKACEPFTREQVSDSAIAVAQKCGQFTPCKERNITSACSCYLPEQQYEKYRGIFPKNCDPLCIGPGAILPTVEGQIIQCQETICLLDNITVDIINSDVDKVTFSQVCSKCAKDSGNCVCYVGNMSIFSEGSHIGRIDLSQNCEQCLNIADDPANPVPVDCADGTPIDGGGGGNGGGESKNVWRKFLDWIKAHRMEAIIVGVALLFLIGIMIWWIYGRAITPLPRSTKQPITMSDLFGSQFEDALSSF